MYKGKAIYNPSGKAGEYSQWACNLYNGCSARCEYCYNRHGITAKVLGGDTPTLKKSLKNYGSAQKIFRMEVDQNLAELQKDGLFFNFVSDPCLPETWALNSLCMRYCVINNIPVKILTKQTWWIDEILDEIQKNESIWNTLNTKRLFAIGFTLTGHDELEPGTASNEDRIQSIKVLSDEGFKTWASIEPIIDFESSLAMIDESLGFCDLYKIGLKSGKKYDIYELNGFVAKVLARGGDAKIYFKDSLIKASGLSRVGLPSFCVDRDYNIFKSE